MIELFIALVGVCLLVVTGEYLRRVHLFHSEVTRKSCPYNGRFVCCQLAVLYGVEPDIFGEHADVCGYPVVSLFALVSSDPRG